MQEPQRGSQLGDNESADECVEDELHCPQAFAGMVKKYYLCGIINSANHVMSAVSSKYHIVINTYRRQMTIPDSTSEHMYRYIWSIVKSRQCNLYRINGIGNHIHMLIELSPTVALSDLVRDIKQGSSKWAKQQAYFPQFSGWGKEYGAFTCARRDKETIMNYIINQREHHKSESFESEYHAMLKPLGLSGMNIGSLDGTG